MGVQVATKENSKFLNNTKNSNVNSIPIANHSNSDDEALWPSMKPIDDHYNQLYGHSEHSVDSGMAWTAVKDTDNVEVCIKK